MITRSAKTYLEALQGYADEYLSATNSATATTAELAEWAIRTERWKPPRGIAMRLCKEDFARALREQYIKDDAGQPVRAKHVLRERKGDQQQYLWADIRNAPRKHIEGSFRQRREQVVGDLRQLDRDNNYWQKMNPNEKPIQIVFDFTDDIIEGRYSGQYPPKKPR
jgi:hypothetical protein